MAIEIGDTMEDKEVTPFKLKVICLNPFTVEEMTQPAAKIVYKKREIKCLTLVKKGLQKSPPSSKKKVVKSMTQDR